MQSIGYTSGLEIHDQNAGVIPYNSPLTIKVTRSEAASAPWHGFKPTFIPHNCSSFFIQLKRIWRACYTTTPALAFERAMLICPGTHHHRLRDNVTYLIRKRVDFHELHQFRALTPQLSRHLLKGSFCLCCLRAACFLVSLFSLWYWFRRVACSVEWVLVNVLHIPRVFKPLEPRSK